MTLEQLAVWRIWLAVSEPQRVDRDEAKLRVAARREQRTAWLRAALARGRELSAPHTSGTAPTRSGADQRSIAYELPPLPGRRERSFGMHRQSSEHESRRPEHRRAPRSAAAAQLEPQAPWTGSPATSPPLDEQRLLREALAALSAQLERLERRVGRGATLAP